MLPYKALWEVVWTAHSQSQTCAVMFTPCYPTVTRVHEGSLVSVLSLSEEILLLRIENFSRRRDQKVTNCCTVKLYYEQCTEDRVEENCR